MEELCKQMEWILLNAASDFSSFTGLAASLILASMVIIVVEHRGDDSPTTALALFTVTLLALGADTFIFGAAGGEVLCARGAAQGLLDGSTMAPGVTILLLGVTLLQSKIKHAHAGLTLLSNVVTGIGALGTMTLLALWTVRFVNNLTILHLRPPPMVSYGLSLSAMGMFLIIIVVVAWTGPNIRTRQSAAVATTCLYLLHIVIAFAMYVATIVISPTQWTDHTDSYILILTITISTVFPFVELIGVVMSLDWRPGRELRRVSARTHTP